MIGGKVSIMTGATGPISAAITACATGVTSLIMGAMFLALGKADLAICGAVDFSLVEPILAGFYTMNGSYSPKPGHPVLPPDKASRPFSVDRRGFVVSEGAGCIILATEEFAKANGLPHDFTVAGWGMNSDASHFVAPNLETVTRCITETLRDARLSPRDIDAVNAHAASTQIGDKIEYKALRKGFNGRIPPVSANKSLIGHAMGAASAIEAIFALEGMKRSVLLPTINHVPDPEMELDCVAEGARKLDQEYVLKNAFGFGGCNSCVVFRRVC
jgi:3-oxoacyl-[acyl-carrier-protein] synthase II